MTATLHRLPEIYRIAWSDGEGCGIVAGFASRNRWEAETALWLMSEKHPELFLWITTCIR